MNKMKRRDFIKGTVAAALTAALPSNAFPSGKYSQNMPYRKLGRTGENVSLLGIGGAHLGKPNSQNAAGGDRSSRPAQLQARENEQKALSLWIKGATYQQIAAGRTNSRRHVS
jgi:hypothetical protein